MAKDTFMKSEQILAPQLMQSTQSQVQSMRGIEQSIGQTGQAIAGEFHRGQDRDFRREMMASEQGFRRGMFDSEMEFKRREADRDYALAKERQEWTQAAMAQEAYYRQLEHVGKMAGMGVTLQAKEESLQQVRQQREYFSHIHGVKAAQLALRQQELANAAQGLELIRQGMDPDVVSRMTGIEFPSSQDEGAVYFGATGGPYRGRGSRSPYGDLPIRMLPDGTFEQAHPTMTGRWIKISPERARRELEMRGMEEKRQRWGAMEGKIKFLQNKARQEIDEDGQVSPETKAELDAAVQEAEGFPQGPQQQGPVTAGDFYQSTRRMQAQQYLQNVRAHVQENPEQVRRILKAAGMEWRKGQSWDKYLEEEIQAKITMDLAAAEKSENPAAAKQEILQRPLEDYRTEFELKLGHALSADTGKKGEDARWFVEGEAAVPLPKEWDDEKVELFYKWVDALKEGKVKPNPKLRGGMLKVPGDPKSGRVYPRSEWMGGRTSPRGTVEFSQEFWHILEQASRQGITKRKSKKDKVYEELKRQLR